MHSTCVCVVLAPPYEPTGYSSWWAFIVCTRQVLHHCTADISLDPHVVTRQEMCADA